MQQGEDVAGCRDLLVIATVTTTQNLSVESCLPNGGDQNRYDKFKIFAPGKACTIQMKSNTTATTPLSDPFLEFWGIGDNTRYDFDDDSGGANGLGGGDAQKTFNSCQTPAGGVIEIRARHFSLNTFGQYRLIVTITP